MTNLKYAFMVGNKYAKKQFCRRGHDTFIIGRDRRFNCLECRRLHSKEWNADRRTYDWSRRKIKNHDGTPFTEVDRDRIYQIQKGSCKLCGVHESKLTFILAVDHDHGSGIFRGLLCNQCNIAVGFLEKYSKNPKFIVYLKGGF